MTRLCPTLTGFLIACFAVMANGALPITKPNIVFVLVDDLGWADLECYGSKFYRTPHLNRLASEGMKFTQAYAAGPVCSPTRASILTGKHPARLHLTDWLPGRADRPSQFLLRPRIQAQLPLEELTLAEALRPAGYMSACIGKWHLGGQGYLPTDQGFDRNVAGDETGTPRSYFAPFKSGDQSMPGLGEAPAGEYLTDRLTTEAERFIEANQSRPFFLYLSHYAVHTPLRAKESVLNRYPSAPAPSGGQTNAIYAAMIESVDDSVGRIMKKLDDLHLTERTLVWFASDNGGLSVEEGPNTPATSNAPLRGGKGFLYEGGIRIPCLIRWPGVIRGGTIDNALVSTVDVFPTIISAAGMPVPGGLDGVDLAPVLRGSGLLQRTALYWHYPHYSNQGGRPGGAVRDGDYKLLQSYEDGRLELFDLATDLAEAHNLAAARPELARSLRTQLASWRGSQQAQMMEPNPEFEPQTHGGGNEVVAQLADGRIVLHARDVHVHGTTVRYEPQPHKRTVGYWTKLEDWVSWEFDVHEPGWFEVAILQGCGTGSGGSEVEFVFHGQTLPVVVQETGGFQNFVNRSIGKVHFDREGRFDLAVRPKTKPGLAVMDLRSVTLQPIRAD